MKVKDAMHKGVQSAAPSTPVKEIAELMVRHDIGAVPVVDRDTLLGMVTDRDLVCRVLTNGKTLSAVVAKDVMTVGVIYCRDNEEINDAIHLMEDKQVRRLPVVDTDGRLVGMLSLGDISHATSQNLAGEAIRAVSAHHEEPRFLGRAG